MTALYSFRLLFLAFHGSPRDEKLFAHARESPKVVTIPLMLLAIPSVVLGGVLFEPMLFDGFFADSIYVREAHDTVATAGTAFDSSARGLILHSVFTPAFWLALAGVGAAWVLYRARPEWPGKIAESSGVLRRILLAKYGFDDFNERALAAGTRGLSRFLGVFVDTKLIDGFFVGGAARLAVGLARAARRMQTGMIYHYAFSLLLGSRVFAVFVVDAMAESVKRQSAPAPDALACAAGARWRGRRRGVGDCGGRLPFGVAAVAGRIGRFGFRRSALTICSCETNCCART